MPNVWTESANTRRVFGASCRLPTLQRAVRGLRPGERRLSTARFGLVPVGPLFDLSPKLPQFRGQIADPIRFLVTDMRDVANGRRPIGKEGHGGKRLDRVADRVHVDVDAV